jgi:hypothetical protein
MIERRSRGSDRPFSGPAVVMWAIALIAALAGCKTTEYRLLLLRELHDERYDLQYRVAAPTAFERARISFASLFGSRPGIPEERYVDDPGTLCQETILALASHPPSDPGTYASTISVLAPISALGENPLSRSYALTVMVFLHRKMGVAPPPLDGELAPFEDAEAAISRLTDLLPRYQNDRRDEEGIAACRTEFARLGGVDFVRIADAASALELLGRYWREPAFRDVTETAIHRIAPRAIVRCLTSALRDLVDFVRTDAIHGLAAMQPPDAAERIAARLRVDPSPDVRRAGARALGQIAALQAVPDLISALEEDDDSSVRWVAMTSLERIAGESLGLYPEPWQEWWAARQEEERANRAAGSAES